MMPEDMQNMPLVAPDATVGEAHSSPADAASPARRAAGDRTGRRRAAAFAGFVALGTWQVQRRAWKLDLIERVDQRVHAPAVAAPGPERWTQVNAASDEYRHVSVTGSFLHDRETLVQAVTELGSGYWVLTPLRMADGRTLLVNRGFVPPEQRERAAARRQRSGRRSPSPACCA